MCSDAQHYCSNSNISGFEVPNNTKVIKNRQSQAVQKTSREVIKPQNLLQAVSKIQTSAKETKRKLRTSRKSRSTVILFSSNCFLFLVSLCRFMVVLVFGCQDVMPLQYALENQ